MLKYVAPVVDELAHDVALMPHPCPNPTQCSVEFHHGVAAQVAQFPPWQGVPTTCTRGALPTGAPAALQVDPGGSTAGAQRRAGAPRRRGGVGLHTNLSVLLRGMLACVEHLIVRTHVFTINRPVNNSTFPCFTASKYPAV